MDASFVQAIRETKDVETIDVNGITYTSRKMYEVERPTAREISVQSLNALVGYCKEELPDGHYVIHVKDEESVFLMTPLDQKLRTREYLVSAKRPYSAYGFGHFMDQEQFIINLMTQFCQNEGTAYLQKIVSMMTNKLENTVSDNGVSQAVAVKKSISMEGEEKIKNPVVLKPYRTFAEVDQPAAPFIFRIDDKMKCALFEADGGVWRIEAVANIVHYLKENLLSEMVDGKITIIG